MQSLTPGAVIGQVRLIAPIGQGMMGVVWKAHHLSLDLPVAAKVLRNPEFADTARYRDRLRREAQLAARLNHPGIVRVLDFVDHHEHPCVVMELVEGTTLDAYLRSRTSLSERTTLLVGYHLASALTTAHEAGILHRDIKPANVLVASDGTLKLSDLGLARPLAESSLTDHRNVMGTPLFMAPELFTRATSPDVRSDLYSLGILLYQLMTGAPPFSGTTAQVIHGHLHVPPDLSVIPERTRHILSSLLAKDPEHRVASARILRETLRERIQQLDAERVRGSEPATRHGTRVGGSDSRLLERLERQLASESIAEGHRIVHTTARERLMVAALFAAMVALAVAGLLATR